jgi:hypothetical protein
MFKRAVFLTSILLSIFALAFADQVSFYVNNQPYQKPIKVKHSQIYIRLHQILPVLGMKMVEKGRIFCAGWAYAEKNLCPQETSSAFLYIDGKPAEKGVFMHHGTLWISVQELASLLGFYYNYSPITEIGELTSPPNLAQIRASSLASSTKSGKKSRSEKKKSPLAAKIVSFVPALFSSNPPMYVVRTTFTVTNVSKKTIRGVTATLVYTRGGKSLPTSLFHGGSMVYQIGTMTPGKTVSEMNRQTTYTLVLRTWHPRVKLNWQGKK